MAGNDLTTTDSSTERQIPHSLARSPALAAALDAFAGRWVENAVGAGMRVMVDTCGELHMAGRIEVSDGCSLVQQANAVVGGWEAIRRYVACYFDHHANGYRWCS